MPKVTIDVDSDVLEGARDAVVALSRVTYGYTFRQFVDDALKAELDRLQAEHNAGEPFPDRGAQPLRKGPTVARRRG